MNLLVGQWGDSVSLNCMYVFVRFLVREYIYIYMNEREI